MGRDRAQGGQPAVGGGRPPRDGGGADVSAGDAGRGGVVGRRAWRSRPRRRCTGPTTASPVGDGVFETIKLGGGAPFALTRHLDRLQRSAAGSGADARRTDAELRTGGGRGERGHGATGRAACASPSPAGRGPMGSARGDDGPTLLVAAGPIGGRPVRHRRGGGAVDPQRARRAGRAQDDVLRRERRGPGPRAEAAGASRGAVRQHRRQAVRGHRHRTCSSASATGWSPRRCRRAAWPASPGPCCSRRWPRPAPPAAEEDIPMAELAAADEVFLVSTGRDVQPVRRVDGRDLPSCPGPLTAGRGSVVGPRLRTGHPLGPLTDAVPGRDRGAARSPGRVSVGRRWTTSPTVTVRRTRWSSSTTRAPSSSMSTAVPTSTASASSTRTRRPSVAERAR